MVVQDGIPKWWHIMAAQNGRPRWWRNMAAKTASLLELVATLMHFPALLQKAGWTLTGLHDVKCHNIVLRMYCLLVLLFKEGIIGICL